MKRSFVCIHGEWIALDECEFIDIQEDFSGRDLVTFEYKGEEYTSYVTQRYWHLAATWYFNNNENYSFQCIRRIEKLNRLTCPVLFN